MKLDLLAPCRSTAILFLGIIYALLLDACHYPKALTTSQHQKPLPKIHSSHYISNDEDSDYFIDEPTPHIRFPPGGKTVHMALNAYEPYALARLTPYFKRAGVTYPPKEVALIAYKDSKRLEMWAKHQDAYRRIKRYRIKAASGSTGPKLVRGDYQVPEGLYQITQLNPNSQFHLSLRLNYPNAQDRQFAKLDGRTNLGGDIYIHGKDLSIGCLAMGDETIEELFVLTGTVGIDHVKVIISPRVLSELQLLTSVNLRKNWMRDLYMQITKAIRGIQGG